LAGTFHVKAYTITSQVEKKAMHQKDSEKRMVVSFKKVSWRRESEPIRLRSLDLATAQNFLLSERFAPPISVK
jgi:hypothetical protein